MPAVWFLGGYAAVVFFNVSLPACIGSIILPGFFELYFLIHKTKRSRRDYNVILFFCIPALIFGSLLARERISSQVEPGKSQFSETIQIIPIKPLVYEPGNPLLVKYQNQTIEIVNLRRFRLQTKSLIKSLSCRPYTTLRLAKQLQNISSYCIATNITSTSLISPDAKLTGRLNTYPFAYALFSANTSQLHPTILDASRQLGIAHVFAASGLHLGILFYFLLWFAKRQQRIPAEIIPLLFCALYTLLLNFPVSLTRAMIFLCLYSFSKIFGFRVYFPSLLTFAAAIIEIFMPGSMFTVGFLFSFLVTASIVFLQKPIFNLLKPMLPSQLAELVSIQLAATVCAGPLSFFIFDQYSVLTIAFNLLLVPLLPFTLLICWLQLIYATPFIMESLESFFFSFIKYGYLYHTKIPIDNSILPFYIIAVPVAFGTLGLMPTYLQTAYAHRLRWLFILFFLPILHINERAIEKRLTVYPGRVFLETANTLEIGEIKQPFVYNLQKPRHRGINPTIVHKAAESYHNIKREYPLATHLESKSITTEKSFLIVDDHNCIIFFSFLNTEFFSKKHISRCKAIILVHQKSERINSKDWIQTLQKFQFSGELRLIQYRSQITLPELS